MKQDPKAQRNMLPSSFETPIIAFARHAQQLELIDQLALEIFFGTSYPLRFCHFSPNEKSHLKVASANEY
jgi:hypothetical protein